MDHDLNELECTLNEIATLRYNLSEQTVFKKKKTLKTYLWMFCAEFGWNKSSGSEEKSLKWNLKNKDNI